MWGTLPRRQWQSQSQGPDPLRRRSHPTHQPPLPGGPRLQDTRAHGPPPPQPPARKAGSRHAAPIQGLSPAPRRQPACGQSHRPLRWGVQSGRGLAASKGRKCGAAARRVAPARSAALRQRGPVGFLWHPRNPLQSPAWEAGALLCPRCGPASLQKPGDFLPCRRPQPPPLNFLAALRSRGRGQGAEPAGVLELVPSNARGPGCEGSWCPPSSGLMEDAGEVRAGGEAKAKAEDRVGTPGLSSQERLKVRPRQGQ